MNARIIALLSMAVLSLGTMTAQENPNNTKAKYHKAFVEDFSKKESKYFIQRRDNRHPNGDFRYFPASESRVEKDTDIMLYHIDPNDPAGAGRGPEIISKNYTSYGTYSARIRVPDVKAVQPNVGAVVGYFTYNMEPGKSLSEIDWEWLIADPELVYIGTWTSNPEGKLQRVGRIVNLAKGEVLITNWRSAAVDGNRDHILTGEQAQPETVPAIEGYNASKQFYVYGFDWYPDRLTWWIEHPETKEKIVLWDYKGTTPYFTGIPDNRTYYRLNFWHTNNWAVETNPNSLEAPKYTYELECDWMSYTPYDIK